MATMVIPKPNQGQSIDDSKFAKNFTGIIDGISAEAGLIKKSILKLVKSVTGKELADKISDAIEDPKDKKDKKKQTKDWFKWFRRDTVNDKLHKKDRASYWKIFKGIGKQLGGILKAVSSNLLMDILKFVLFMAIFDPTGEFLSSILSMLGSVFESLWNMLAPWIPIIFDRMVNLITTVLPNILIKVIEGIFGFISRKFKELAKNAKSGPAKWIFETLANLFDPQGGLAGILKGLAKLLPVIIIVLIALKIFFILLPIFVAIKAIVLFLAGTILGIPLAIAGILIALWVFRDEIYDFLTNVPIWLEEKFGWFGIVLGKVFSAITAPIMAIVTVMRYISEVGFMNILKQAWNAIKKWVGDRWKVIKMAVSAIWESIKAPFVAVWSVIKSIVQPFLDIIKVVFPGVYKVIKDLWSLIKNGILSGFKGIMDAFYSIFDWIDMVTTYGIDYIMGNVTDSDKEEFTKMKKLSRDTGVDMGKIEKVIEARGEDRTLALSKLNAAERQVYANVGGEDATNYKKTVNNYTASTMFAKTVSISRTAEPQ